MATAVYLYVYDSMSDWEYAYATCGIRNPMFQSRPGRYTVVTLAESRSPVVTAGGIRLIPDRTLEELGAEDGAATRDAAMLLLPGGEGWDGHRHDAILQLAKSFIAANLPVAAICGATLGLARAGLLNNVRHTSNLPAFLTGERYSGQNLYQTAPAVRDGSIITASGLAPLEFTRLVFESLELYTPELLAAWYDLYTTQDPSHFFRLMEANPGGLPG